jgi:hypothetical protein
MGVDDRAEDPTGTAKEAIDWSGPGDEGPEESITFGAGKLTDDEEPQAEVRPTRSAPISTRPGEKD